MFTDADRVNKGLEMIRKVYQGRVDKGKMSASEMDQKMKLVIGTTSYDDFKDCDLVIEAVFRKHESEAPEVFQELEKGPA